MKRNTSDAQLIVRAPRYNVDDYSHNESPPVYTGPPPAFQRPHSKFGALGSVTADDCRNGLSIEGGRAFDDAVDGGSIKKVFSFSGYVGTPHFAVQHEVGLVPHHRPTASIDQQHHLHPHHLDNGIDAIKPAHYNECTKALSSSTHAVLGSCGSSGRSSCSGTATPSPCPSPPLPSSSSPSPLVQQPAPAPPRHAPRLSAEARSASQSHGSLLDMATGLLHMSLQHRLHEQQQHAGSQPPAGRPGLKSRGSEPNFLSSRLVGAHGRASAASSHHKQPLISAQDLNALAPLDL